MRWSAVAVFLMVGVGLCGCAAAKKTSSGDAGSSDQSQVVEFAPLSIPPDFYLVPTTPAPLPQASQPASTQEQATVPPVSGDLQATDQSASAQAQTSSSSADSASNEAGSASPDLSAGEQAFLDAANVDKADPDIRQLLATDGFASEGVSKTLTDSLILWDPAQQKVAAPGTSGGAVPTITRAQASPLSGIFN